MSAIDPWRRLAITPAHLLQAHVSDPARLLHVCVEAGEIVGAVSFRLSGAGVVLQQRGASDLLRKHYGGEPRDGGYIHNLAAFPGFTGSGYGLRLLKHAEALVRTTSDRLYLFVSGFNTNARRFYEREGFECIGSVPNCLQPGNTENLMLKLLTPA
jgi:ribosomal protein S18 acetylase RimI-like enzyme